MGRNKALLPLPGNPSLAFVEQLVCVLAPFCAEILLVARDEADAANYMLPGVRVVCDKAPDYGPLMGLYSGLSAMRTEYALVVAVDMPFVQPALLAFLLSYIEGDFLVVPVADGVPQVLLAIYPCSILPVVEVCMEQGRRDPRSLLEVAPVHYVEEAQLREVDPKLRSFVGINTPEELRELMEDK